MGLCHSDEKKKEGNNKTEEVGSSSKACKGKPCVDEAEVKEVHDIFDKYDRNKDGVLERDEVMAMFKYMNRHCNGSASWKNLEEYVNNFMLNADSKGQGKIDKRDFFNYYKGK